VGRSAWPRPHVSHLILGWLPGCVGAVRIDGGRLGRCAPRDLVGGARLRVAPAHVAGQRGEGQEFKFSWRWRKCLISRVVQAEP
jgi:hypothetical protein